jgi:hypothetical protein
MCFTPLVSIITAIIEFGIASYLFYKIKDRKLYPLAVFVLLLGLYQFTEFMLCKSDNTIFWARIGFASYTFLPILLYHFFINASGNKINNFLYTIPAFFTMLALFYPNFINYTSCNAFHVTVESLIYNKNLVLMSFYLLYYLYFPVYSLYIFSKKIRYRDAKLNMRLGVAAAPFAVLVALLYYLWSAIYENNQIQTWLYTSIMIIVSLFILILLSSFLFKRSKKLFYQTNSLILATTGLTIIILYYLVPNITFNYSSIFCHFALLYGIASVLLIDALEGRVLNT